MTQLVVPRNHPPSPEHSLDILVVDDAMDHLAYLEAKLKSQGHRPRRAETGAGALRQVDQRVPDLIILEVLLPDSNGMGLVASLRAKTRNRRIPILLMSSLESQGELVKGLEAGADDFLVKPVHGGVLNAKIRTMQRIARTNAELSEAAQLLERYRDGAEGELQLARNLIQHMINRDGLKDPALEWFVLPSAKFSGDLVASVREESDRLYVFFADASGHGLAAAISGLPVLQIFYAMAAKGIAVGEIAREMNIKLKEYLPMGRYLAAILVCVDFGRREVQVWNGGMPTGLVLVDGESKTNDALQSRQVPLCVIGNELFDANAVRFSWNETTRLLFVSDGVLEATDPAGEPFGMSRLLKSAGRRGQNGLVAPILQALRLHQRGAAAHDDVSILTITLP